MEQIQPINRRTLLQRGLVLLAGALGLEVVEPGSRAQAALVAQSDGAPLRLYARRWQGHPHGLEAGELPASSGRLNRQGELLAAPNGEKIGEFQTTCFCQEGSFGACAAKGASIELQTFKLGEDTLFGMGCFNPTARTAQLQAIVGGTGRFAGARGSYRINRAAGKGSGDNVEIVLTILT